MKTQVVTVQKLQEFLTKIRKNNKLINIIPNEYVYMEGTLTDEGEVTSQTLISVLVIYHEF